MQSEQVPCRDTNNDGLPDTGIIQPGETFAKSNDRKIEETCDSAGWNRYLCGVHCDFLNKPDARQIVQMNTSIPAPFVQTRHEGQRIFMELFSEFNSYLALEHDAYRGSSFMMNRQPEAMYLGLWEHNELSSSVTNLYFTFVSSTGIRLTADPIQLTDNQEPGYGYPRLQSNRCQCTKWEYRCSLGALTHGDG